MEGISLKTIVESNFREHGAILQRIEEQVVKTNGRVTKLEQWRSMLVGAWIMTTLILLPTGFFVIEILLKR